MKVGGFPRSTSSGFTLPEMVIVIGIVVLLIGVAVASYRTFGQNISLEAATQRVVIVIDEARNRTIGSEDDSHFGVHFETDRYVLFKGDSYSPSSSDNVIHTLPTGIEISAITLAGGGSDVKFEGVTGTTQQTGTITLRRSNDPSVTQTITITSLGQSDQAGIVAPIDSRLTDTRHAHFDLGWSIQGTTTLTLVFVDSPNVTYEVTMADYFNADQTDFNWSQTVDVNGNPERLRIQSHSIDATNTVLSVERDQRDNQKGVSISIDGHDIATYAADGDITLGPDGGTLEIQ